MCGIVGWLSYNDAAPVRGDIVARMRDSMVHRGPDGEGIWLSPDSRVGLGFRRLAIIDLSTSALQPMTNEDGTVWLVFNGEIYNHEALRKELIAAGHRFQTDHSDTETIVHGYEQWGEKVVEHLHGMFGIGIWDSRRRRLFLARDRIGIKPLYFTWTSNGFLFASEIKALLEHPSVSADIEPRATYHYLSFNTTPAPLTMFKGIYKLPAGHRAVLDTQGSFSAEAYWDALPGMGEEADEMRGLSAPALDDYATRRTRELLREAVEKRMMSDVPFGVFLSGGIDSSTNVALMSQFVNVPLRTFTVGFSDHPENNELSYASLVAKHFKTEHHEVMVDEKAMSNYLPSLVYSQDEPIADWVCIPLYFVSKLVRDTGTRVVQVGEGSDEQFCGYGTYMAYLRMNPWHKGFERLPSLVKRGVASVANWLAAIHDHHDNYLDVAIRVGRGRELFWSGTLVLAESRKEQIIDRSALAPLEIPERMHSLLPSTYANPDSFEVVRSFFERIDKAAPRSDLLTRMIYSEFKLRLPELLLMRVDKIGMSVSIEPRVPFLDHKLVEFTMNVPMAAKVRGGVAKALLKRAVRGLIPDEIIDRPKMGFGAPMAEWMRGRFGKAVEAELASSQFFNYFPADRGAILNMLKRHRSGEADFSGKVWVVYNAVAWFDQWIDGGKQVRAA
jgi:asparagine synthase (glutamine-hydrolysing)